jgi:uncharacterized RDD family membrane protein YckC
VVIGGSAKVKGKVRDAAVVIGGDLDIEGEVGDAAVAVMGNVRAGQGAKINGEVVSVGGKADISEDATVGGRVQETNFGGALPRAEWLRNWFSRGLLKLRPLAPGVGWVWGGWCILILIYLLIAAAFPKPVQACMDELTRRPATSFLMGLLTQLLIPLVLLILVAIVIGIIVVPFVLAALAVGFVVGKVAIMEWLGFKIGIHMKSSGMNPAAALLIGAVVLTILYLIPVLGMLTFLIVSVWGLGIAVMAAFGGLRRELPGKGTTPATMQNTVAPQTPPGESPTPGPVASPVYAFQQTPSPGFSASSEPVPPSSSEAVPPLVGQPPPIDRTATAAAAATTPEAWTFPKATFWERLGAAFLDIVLVSMLGHAVGGPPQAFVVALAYFAGMWAWKATTIGGIVIGLKVARLDGQQINFTIALIRALAAVFSVLVLFLGFLWIIWDKDRQGWHDRIAGTVVIKLPKGTPLVCL